MPEQPVTPPDSKKALLQAFDEVLKTQAAEREAERAGPRQAGRVGVVAWAAVFTLLFTAAYLWLERPAWLFPVPPPPESVAVKEASLRIALANTARHVELFRQKHGRLPATLEETGTVPSGIGYESTPPDRYLLRGVNEPVRLILRSTDSLRVFVGKSFETIARRSR